jgi:soluble lytic murein transglycosylase
MTKLHSWVRIIPVRWYREAPQGGGLRSAGEAEACPTTSTPAVLALVAGLVVGLCSGLAAAQAPARKAPAKKPSGTAKQASQAAAGPRDLTGMVRAYRAEPGPARRAAIVGYAGSHPKEAGLAQFALGITAYEAKDYPYAIAKLQPLGARLPQLNDYIGYYLNASRVESKDTAAVAKDLGRVYGGPVVSPLRARAWVVEARAIAASRPAEALRILSERAADLPQPEGDVALGEVLRASGDLAGAARAWQRVYYRYPGGEPAEKASAALAVLRASMGSDYPAPDTDARMRRADRLVELRDWARARAEYQEIAAATAGADRERALVRAAAIDIWRGQPKIARAQLRALNPGEPDPAAEALSHVAEANRRLREDDGMMEAVDELGRRFAKSPWRLKALVAGAHRLWMANRPDRYVPYFRAVAQDFPSDAQAPPASWRVAFAAHMARDRSAGELMREHVRRFPEHSSASTAMYFLGRRAEAEGDTSAARSWYTRVAAMLPNSFYGAMARQRLTAAAIASARTASAVEQFLAAFPVPARTAPGTAVTPALQTRAERAKLLRAAGFPDLADGELRFGARVEGQPWLVGTEMAAIAEEPWLGLRAMKSMAGDYLAVPFDLAPRKLWEPLFPLPFRDDVMGVAEHAGLDPYVLAGLIRQESEFNPKAVSRARAYGLTQVLPSTGREYARSAGVARVTVATLTQPLPNLKLGSTILKSLYHKYSGKWELALAGYNAGPGRVAQWLEWNTYNDPVEFIESIPILETREYVQAVLRNADMYRRLYGGKATPLLADRRRR